MRRIRRLFLAAFATAALLMESSAAAKKPRELYRPSSLSQLTLGGVLRALKVIRSHIDGQATSGRPCGGGCQPVKSYNLTGRQLTIRCSDHRDHVFRFQDIQGLGVAQMPGEKIPYVAVITADDAFTIHATKEQARMLADAFFLLMHKRRYAEPIADTEFLAAVAAAKASGVRSEDQRRTVVQADAMLKENRTEDALLLYLKGLQTSPDWALGHYNLALIYASLELLPEAIKEMKRYLYLAPDAEDARAARDQVYAWEAHLKAR